ncbi:MAG: BatA domain-containing protein [Planctomycetota bacterium]|nr:BatA domain-containing protein [Planctomycetota bacterium]
MTFVTAGLAMAGLISIGLPILIHLLSRQRRKPIEWGAMRFLLEAFRKHQRRLQIEHLLLLLLRCLIIALIGFALARPLLEDTDLFNVGGSRAVFLVIDDGLASNVTSEQQETALERHVNDAIELIRTLDLGDTVGLVTCARPARGVLTPPSSDHNSVIAMLEELKPRQSPTDVSGALTLLRQAVEDMDDRYDEVLVYLLSEFRTGSAPMSSPLPDTLKDVGRSLTLLASPPASDPINNTQILSLRPVRSVVLPGVLDGSGQIMVRLGRSGGTLGPAITQVRLTGDGIENVKPKTVEWAPGQSEAGVEFSLDFAVSGDRSIGLTASIDNDSLGADNTRFTVLELRDQIRVLVVDRRSFGFQPTIDRMPAGLWIRRALEPSEESPIEVVNVEPTALDVVDLRSADAVVLSRPDLLPDGSWGMLRTFVDGGGLLFVCPPGEINVHPWVERMSDDLDLPWRIMLEVREHDEGLALATDQPASELLRMISSDLDELALPIQAIRSLPIDPDQSQFLAALMFEDGTPFLAIGTPGVKLDSNDDNASTQVETISNGMVIYLAVAPELSWTTLPSKPLMVPLFQETIRQGLSLAHSSQQLHVGTQSALAQGSTVRDLIDPEGEMYPIDAQGRPQQPLALSGLYELLDQGAQNVGSLAVNVEPLAGRTQTQNATAINSWLADSGEWQLYDPEDLGATLSRTRSGSSLAGILLWILMFLVLLETLLARWFSHAFRIDEGEERFGSGLRATIAGVVKTGKAGAS